jgi:hypothetical protein
VGERGRYEERWRKGGSEREVGIDRERERAREGVREGEKNWRMERWRRDRGRER